MRMSQRERHRRMREAQIAAWNESYNVESDPGLRDVYAEIPRLPIRLICCPLVKDVNQGGMLRLAEAYRLSEVVFSPESDGVTDFAGSRGTRIWQPYRWEAVEYSVPAAKRAGFTTVAVTLSERAVPLSDVPWTFPLAVVVGEEKFGVPSFIETQCDLSVAIPLFGLVTSLNVTTAAAIVINDAVTACFREHPEMEPVRNASRRLLGLPPRDYSET